MNLPRVESRSAYLKRKQAEEAVDKTVIEKRKTKKRKKKATKEEKGKKQEQQEGNKTTQRTVKFKRLSQQAVDSLVRNVSFKLVLSARAECKNATHCRTSLQVKSTQTVSGRKRRIKAEPAKTTSKGEKRRKKKEKKRKDTVTHPPDTVISSLPALKSSGSSGVLTDQAGDLLKKVSSDPSSHTLDKLGYYMELFESGRTTAGVTRDTAAGSMSVDYLIDVEDKTKNSSASTDTDSVPILSLYNREHFDHVSTVYDVVCRELESSTPSLVPSSTATTATDSSNSKSGTANNQSDSSSSRPPSLTCN